jgi:hypothetical protein
MRGYATPTNRYDRHCGRRSRPTSPAIHTGLRKRPISRNCSGMKVLRARLSSAMDRALAISSWGQSWLYCQYSTGAGMTRASAMPPSRRRLSRTPRGPNTSRPTPRQPSSRVNRFLAVSPTPTTAPITHHNRVSRVRASRMASQQTAIQTSTSKLLVPMM